MAVADFVALPETVLSLSPGGDIDADVRFDLDTNPVAQGGTVLSWVQDASMPNNLTYTMAINGAALFSSPRRVDSATQNTKPSPQPHCRMARTPCRSALRAEPGPSASAMRSSTFTATHRWRSHS